MFGPFRPLGLADMDAPGAPALDEGECIEGETSWPVLDLETDGPGGDGFERAAWALADAARRPRRADCTLRGFEFIGACA